MLKQNLSKRHVIVLLLIGLLLSLAVFNGLRFWDLISVPADQQAAQSDAPSLKKTENLPTPTPQVIASWNLMGREKSKKVVQAPKTNLRLKLIGIISSTADGQARAIVEDSSRKQKYYKVGDKIKNNVSVKSIYPDHIVIVHNSKDEIVPLNTKKSKQSIIQKVVIQ